MTPETTWVPFSVLNAPSPGANTRLVWIPLSGEPADGSVSGAHTSLMNSSGHRANILGSQFNYFPLENAFSVHWCTTLRAASVH